MSASPFLKPRGAVTMLNHAPSQTRIPNGGLRDEAANLPYGNYGNSDEP